MYVVHCKLYKRKWSQVISCINKGYTLTWELKKKRSGNWVRNTTWCLNIYFKCTLVKPSLSASTSTVALWENVDFMKEGYLFNVYCYISDNHVNVINVSSLPHTNQQLIYSDAIDNKHVEHMNILYTKYVFI